MPLLSMRRMAGAAASWMCPSGRTRMFSSDMARYAIFYVGCSHAHDVLVIIVTKGVRSGSSKGKLTYHNE